MSTEQPLLMTLAEAAAECGIRKTLAYKMAADGRLPSIRLGGAIRVPRAALLSWIDASTGILYKMARPPRRKRRLRGTGSVFARNGRWEGRWQAPADGSGERPWVRAYALSESECDEKLSEAIRNYKRGGATADTRTTLSTYLEVWLERVSPGLKPTGTGPRS
jgi:excisionase family DNA binding protein